MEGQRDSDREKREGKRGKRGKEGQGKFWTLWRVCYTRLNIHNKKKQISKANINKTLQLKKKNCRGTELILTGLVGFFFVYFNRNDKEKKTKKNKTKENDKEEEKLSGVDAC